MVCAMYFKEIDPAGDPRDLAAVLPVIRAAAAGFVPGEVPPCGQQVRQWAGRQFRTTKVSIAAFAEPGEDGPADGAAVGVLIGNHSDHNPDLLGGWTFISPDAVGPRIAGGLMDSAADYCRERGIKRLLINTALNADAGRYGPQRGSTPSFVGDRWLLDLTALDRTGLEALSSPSPANAAYRIVHWVDSCPDELATAYCVARAAMNDAPPVADDLANPVYDSERMRAEEASTIECGIRLQVTAAIGADGAIGGFSMTAVYPEQPELTEIWDTGVARDHRGRGLGLRIKAAATLRLLHDHPGARQLCTFTSVENTWMIAVNRRIGYRPVGTWEMYVHELAGEDHPAA